MNQKNSKIDYEPVPLDEGNIAVYIRRSTFKQENEHQVQAIKDWLNKENLHLKNTEIYSETASGASRSREELNRLIDDIESDEIDHVVIWELSRIAREGQLAQEFFNLCETHFVHIHVTSGSIREIKPDGSNRFVADILAAVYAEERRTLIRRTKYGRDRARSQDKWTTKPPLGFTTDSEGYLIPNIEAFGDDFNNDKDSFWDIQHALEKIEVGDSSYNAEAKELHTVRQSLSRVHQNPQHLQRYLDLDADDSRVNDALEIIREHEESEAELNVV